MAETSDIIKKHVSNALGWDTDLTAEHAEGIHVTMSDGNTYMDFTSGIAVLNVGHRHPKVMARVRKQLDHYVHSGCTFFYESVATLSKMLAEVAPGDIDSFFWLNSGSESIEAAIKLARFTTKRPAVVAFRGAFHGRTMGATSLTTSNAKYRKYYRPLLPEIYRLPFPYEYVCPGGKVDYDPTEKTLDAMNEMFRLELHPDEIAAVIVEPQQGEGGYSPAPPALMKALREVCDRHGIMLIFDEVQTGFGRTGKWFAADHYGIAPDIICMAKSMAGGFPLSAVGASKKVMDQWPTGAHGTTFGGNPVSCAAAIGVIEAIKDEKLLENGMKIADIAKKRMKEAQKNHSVIGDVRGLGPMIGIELVTEDGNPNHEAFNKLYHHCRGEKLIIVNCGPNGNIIRFIPPLITTEDEMNKALDILLRGIAAL